MGQEGEREFWGWWFDHPPATYQIAALMRYEIFNMDQTCNVIKYCIFVFTTTDHTVSVRKETFVFLLLLKGCRGRTRWGKELIGALDSYQKCSTCGLRQKYTGHQRQRAKGTEEEINPLSEQTVDLFTSETFSCRSWILIVWLNNKWSKLKHITIYSKVYKADILWRLTFTLMRFAFLCSHQKCQRAECS